MGQGLVALGRKTLAHVRHAHQSSPDATLFGLLDVAHQAGFRCLEDRQIDRWFGKWSVVRGVRRGKEGKRIALLHDLPSMALTLEIFVSNMNGTIGFHNSVLLRLYPTWLLSVVFVESLHVLGRHAQCLEKRHLSLLLLDCLDELLELNGIVKGPKEGGGKPHLGHAFGRYQSHGWKQVHVKHVGRIGAIPPHRGWIEYLILHKCFTQRLVESNVAHQAERLVEGELEEAQEAQPLSKVGVNTSIRLTHDATLDVIRYPIVFDEHEHGRVSSTCIVRNLPF